MSQSNLGERFTSKEFSVEKYVSDVSTQCAGGVELGVQRSKLQSISDETHLALKRNVYQHYGQFIETAKDISYLASEMYQISQMLRDQKALIQNILDTSILAARKTQASIVSPTESDYKQRPGEDESRKKLLGVLEKVEGAGEIIEKESRNLIFEGDLLEINPDNYSAVQRKRGYLFNDGIMLAVWVTTRLHVKGIIEQGHGEVHRAALGARHDTKWKSEVQHNNVNVTDTYFRRGPQRYKFEAFYELASIGLVVNIRDPECPKHTFKLLIFPSVHLLQCPNQQEKDAWINQVEGIQKILRNPQKVGSKTGILESPIHEALPAFPSLDSERAKSPEESLGMISFQHPLPDWVMDIPEDLDVWIAQRNFTEAVDLYDTFKEFLESQQNRITIHLKDIKSKADARIKSLIEIIVGDLEIMTPEKILQGGPRSIRKSVDLLVRLGRDNQASQLFLDHRSAYIKNRLKRLKTEGRSQLYLDHLAEIFFSSIVETMKEYGRSFSNNNSGTACLVVWISNEVNGFINVFCRQLFTPQSHLSSVSKSVSKLRSESQKLISFGMDMSCTVDSYLLQHIERTVIDAKDKLIEAVRHRYRSQDEVGVAVKFTDQGSLNKTLLEMTELGINNMQTYLKGELTLQISSNTMAFAKSWLHFCNDLMFLVAPEWQALIETAICEVILVELKHLEHALNKARKRKDNQGAFIIEKDAGFVLDTVCHSANKIYEKMMGQSFPELTLIAEESTLRENRRTPVAFPTAKSPSKTSRFTNPEYV